jgi:LPS sulfotransferase NodH
VGMKREHVTRSKLSNKMGKKLFIMVQRYKKSSNAVSEVAICKTGTFKLCYHGLERRKVHYYLRTFYII